MPTIIQASQIQNLQQIEATVTGPDGANRLIIIIGHIIVGFTGGPPMAGRTEGFSALIGPSLTRQQFIRAIATASMSKAIVNLSGSSNYQWGISGIDADRDDESGQVELKFDLFAGIDGQNAKLSINEVDFQVTILAAN